MDKLGNGKNLSKQEALTVQRAQKDGQVRKQEEFKQVRGTHRLKSVDGQTSQCIKRTKASKGHLQTGEHRWTGELVQGKNSSKRGTHRLESVERWKLEHEKNLGE